MTASIHHQHGASQLAKERGKKKNRLDAERRMPVGIVGESFVPSRPLLPYRLSKEKWTKSLVAVNDLRSPHPLESV